MYFCVPQGQKTGSRDGVLYFRFVPVYLKGVMNFGWVLK